MEILGSTFDDSVFEESRKKASTVLPSSYNAKVCEPEWFCDRSDTEDVLEKQKTFKFRADLAYRRKDYQTALDDYTTCLSLIPDGNLSIKRDVLESMARCCSHLGRQEQSLELTDQLRKEISNTCHLTCVLHLELSIHERFGDARSRIAALQQLCSIHPFNPWHWLKLATSYQNLLESLSSSSSPSRRSPHRGDGVGGEAEARDEQQLKEGRSARLKACMCFIRTRLLIGILKTQQLSFVLQSSERALRESTEALQRLQPSGRALRVLAEVMAEDLNPEKIREENQDGESLAGLCIRAFDERWWERLTGLLREGGPELAGAGLLMEGGPGLLREGGPELAGAGLLREEGPELAGAGLLREEGPELAGAGLLREGGPGLLMEEGPELAGAGLLREGGPGLLMEEGPELAGAGLLMEGGPELADKEVQAGR